MTVEARVPTREEMPAYYRCLPYANGLPSWEPAPAAWHGGPEPWSPMRRPASPEQLDRMAREDMADDRFHPVGAFEGGQCVGASATVSFDVTVPGDTMLPMAGVTATGVIATHRRRGHLRRMMQHMFSGALQRGEPLAMLSASEGSIYGNFGFWPATHRTRWEIERHEANFRAGPDDTGSLHLVDAAQAKVAWPDVHAVVRRTRVGELSPQPGRWDGLSDEPDGTNDPLRYLVHRNADGQVDGIANYRLPWSAHAESSGTLVVEAFEATTAEAYRAMWQLLLDFDLTRRVVAAGRPRDEPLRWMLTNPRAMRVTRQSDNLWARLLDVPAALSRRSYAVDDDLVIGVDDDIMCPANNGRWRLVASGGESSCHPTDDPADVVTSIGALSSIYLGGMSASDLAYAGHIEGAVTRLGALFRGATEPHNSFAF